MNYSMIANVKEKSILFIGQSIYEQFRHSSFNKNARRDFRYVVVTYIVKFMTISLRPEWTIEIFTF